MRTPVFNWNHPFGQLLGMEIVELQPGFSLITMAVCEELMNPFRTLHGGASYALADSGMAAALYHQLADDQNCATINIQMQYYHQVHEGVITAESRVLHVSKRLASVECILYDASHRIVARATGTFAIIDINPPK